jgi:NAD(P)-dependent dehydrogenase (short-subunit alcohol dehydrogenase family)
MEEYVEVDQRFRLDGRVALITAAGGAFGRAIAVGMARAGAHLLLSDVDPTRLAEVATLVQRADGTCATQIADVGSLADVEALYAALDRSYGQIDVLVNIAGIGPRGPADTFPLADLEKAIRVNVIGTFAMCQAAGQRMIKRGRGGSIINFSSIAGSSTLGRGSIAYGTTKSAIDQMTRELAVEWAPHRVRVNAIKPCQFLNEGWRSQVADPARRRLVQRVLDGIPMGRMGEPEEMVGPVIFLASDAASMVTGILLPVDGGNLAYNPTGTSAPLT